jgi:conjugal transfer mating pair stabilization protein TraN
MNVTQTEQWDDKCPVLDPTGRCTVASTDRCVDGPSTKKVGGIDVTKACWAYERTMSCTSGASNDECAPLVAAGCTATGNTCVNTDPVTGSCAQYQDTYQCPSVGETITTASNCPTDVFCLGTSCFNISYANDADFAKSMSYMEAAREAGVYMDIDKLKVFNGEDGRCRDRLLKNCCYTDGAGKGMTNQSTFGTGSRLVYDVLMNSDNREFLNAGLQALMSGAGFSGTFSSYGFTLAVNGAALPSGSTVLYASSTVAGEGVVLAFDPWSLAIAVIIYVIMQLMSCSENEGRLALQRGAALCHEVGSYCSSSILGSCVTTTHSHCCFNSVLSRSINEQGRPQVGRGWGSAQNPSCGGFTIAELQSLNFAAMDFTEFYASIVPVLPNVSGIQGNNTSRVPACYYGQGKC